jgi:hypothetical protein
MAVADRIIDTVKDAGMAHCKRRNTEAERIPPALWGLNGFMAFGMFLGVAVVRSGSAQLYVPCDKLPRPTPNLRSLSRAATL